MAFYNDEFIEEVKNANDIVDVVSQYVTLKRSGRNYFGLCPFHKEKSPSFSVSQDKQIFRCFGCGEGGNVIRFIQKINGLDFREAIESLADRAGMTLPNTSSFNDNRKLELKKKVYEINKEAAQFFHDNLYKPTAKEAQNYVKKRKLDNKTLKAFMIGYSSPKYSELYEYLKSKGYADEEILESSLVIKTEKGSFVDRFRARFMIPIQDVRGRVIAFGGRKIDDFMPRELNSPDAKYVNSPATIVYTKGMHLFGLNVAKNFDTSRLLIVEGYMDAISLFQRGITNVVASLGTALTENQGRLLKKHSKQIILGYDADSAGQDAIIRGLEILTAMGCDVRVLQIPREEAKDPDEYIIKFGSARLAKLMDEAISLVEYKVKVLKNKMQINSSADKIKFLNEIANILVPIDSQLEQEIYIDKISKEYKISKEAIYAQVNKIKYGNANPKKTLLSNKPILPKKSNTDNRTDKMENILITLMLENGSNVYEKIRETICPDDFNNQENVKIVKKMYEEFEKGKSNIEDIYLLLGEDEEAIKHVTAIISNDIEINDIDKCIDDILEIYRKQKLMSKKEEIIKRLDNPNLSKDEANSLEKELSEIILKLAKKKLEGN